MHAFELVQHWATYFLAQIFNINVNNFRFTETNILTDTFIAQYKKNIENSKRTFLLSLIWIKSYFNSAHIVNVLLSTKGTEKNGAFI